VVTIQQLVTDLRNGPVASKAAMTDEAEDIPANEPARQSEREFSDGAERVRAAGAERIRTVSQPTAKFEGTLKGVDAVATVIADVQGSPAVGTAVLLDVKDQAAKHRVFGPLEPHGCASGTSALSLFSLPRQGWPV
jgi:hypothetical protein